MKKIIMGSIIGGVSTLTIFISLSSMLSLLFKIALGILMVVITFGFQTIKYTMNNLFYLLTISFTLGGVLYLLMDNYYYNYFILIIVFITVTFIYIKQLKGFQDSYANYYIVEIFIKNTKLKVTGYLDTGNKLYDSYKHRPIILIDKKIKYNLEDIIYVPYSSLNNEGILKCLKADYVVINNHVFHDYLIGLSNHKFKIDGINCLLHSKMKGVL